MTDAHVEQLYTDALPYYDAVLADIAAARHSVCLETYIFAAGKTADRFIAELGRAAARGVKVSVLVDGIGSLEHIETLVSRLHSAGVVIKVFHPLPWQADGYRWAVKRGSFASKLVYFLTRINNRDHRKLCTVDEHIAWIGSYNVSDTHLPDSAGGENWNDIAVRISGKRAEEINSSFFQVWRGSYRRLRQQRFESYFTALNQRLRRRRNTAVLHAIRQARYELWIASAYFAPAPDLLQVILRAGLRGVDVRVIVPRVSDVSIFPLLTETYFSDLLGAGVKIYEYGDGFLHAKAMICDGRFILGSTNMNNRSFNHDLELDVALLDEASQRALRDYMLGLQGQSRQVDQRRLRRLPLVRALWGQLARLLRYWM